VNEIFLLVFKRVFEIDTNWKYIRNFDDNFENPSLNVSIENKHTNLKYTYLNFETQFKIRWWCSPFALGLIISPLLALMAKNRDFESPFYIFSPFGKRNMSERLYQIGVMWSDGEG
jgi:hypothetical protein